MKLSNWGHRVANWKRSRNDQKPLEHHLLHLHEEVSEVFGKVRDGWPLDKITYEGDEQKPEGFGIELADVVLVAVYIADACGIDLENCMEAKMDYNERRRGKGA